ncbi:type VI secretion system lipoprotein TssJ [Vibrio sp. S9_S30]|uniref:type VI secretion system lipoprotein TssJ n=2 Tax=Vibrio sp. S9_S30 TaxID=2720226 RepID=UPI001680D9D6|nr:type VI secretion system lipoprotein TssJ [Vibrio sp. S9_S30]
MRQMLSIVLGVLLLAGCSSSEDVKEQPSVVSFSMVADEGVNPNVFGEASPVEIQVFELVDDSMFMSADFDQINEDHKKVLKSNYIRVYDYVLTPGQFKYVDDVVVDNNTRYIGVLAKFAEPELSEWKKAVKIINLGRKYHLLMLFKDYDIKLDKVE